MSVPVNPWNEAKEGPEIPLKGVIPCAPCEGFCFTLDPVTGTGSVWTEMDSQWKPSQEEDHGIKIGLSRAPG